MAGSGSIRVGSIAIGLGAALLWSTRIGSAQEPSPPAGWRSPVEAVTVATQTGPIVDIAMSGERVGYASVRSGAISWFEIPRDPHEPIRERVVMTGLVNPRGIAVRNGILHVVELGSFPCAEEVGLCEGPVLDPEHPADGEVAILRAMRAHILAYEILADGSLGPAREILTDLPVVNALHAVNGLSLGPDGALYVAIGNVDRLWYQPERVLGTTPHPEWLGTILRLGPDGSEPEIVASGLRNVYDITFDDTGRMWAVDNDGPTTSGYRMEEVLLLQEGHDYGYPAAGTFLGPRGREDGPAWLSETQGSGGIAWAVDAGLTPGLLIGDCNSLSFLGPRPGRVGGTEWERALNPGDQTVLGTGPACMTSIVPLGDGEILVGSQGLQRIRFAAPDAD